MKRKTGWGLLIASAVFLFFASVCFGSGDSSSSPSKAAGIVTIKTDNAKSLLDGMRRAGAGVWLEKDFPTTIEEYAGRTAKCVSFFINVYQMLGKNVRFVAIVKIAELPARMVCVSDAMPTPRYAMIICGLEGRELADLRPDAREIDCKLPLPPGAKSA